MRTTDHDERDLSAVLREWKITRPLPPRFQEEVWRRIQHADRPSRDRFPFWTALVIWLEGLALQPARAVSVVALLLALGGGLGWVQAQHHSSRVHDELSLRYVRLIDPYEAIR